MIVSLSDRGTVTGEPLLAFLIRFENGPIRFRLFFGQPRQQSGAEVETDVRIVVGDLHDVPVAIQNSRGPIWRITLRGDPLIPVMKRVCGILQLNELEPCVFSRRLIEMSVYTDVAVHQSSTSFSNTTTPWDGSVRLPCDTDSIISGTREPFPIQRGS